MPKLHAYVPLAALALLWLAAGRPERPSARALPAPAAVPAGDAGPRSVLLAPPDGSGGARRARDAPPTPAPPTRGPSGPAAPTSVQVPFTVHHADGSLERRWATVTITPLPDLAVPATAFHVDRDGHLTPETP